jgi:hypothetical protein
MRQLLFLFCAGVNAPVDGDNNCAVGRMAATAGRQHAGMRGTRILVVDY